MIVNSLKKEVSFERRFNSRRKKGCRHCLTASNIQSMLSITRSS